MARAPKQSEENWDETEAAAPAEEHVEVVCVSHDRPHFADNEALAFGEKKSIPHSVAKKLLKSRHIVRAEDYEE